MKTRLGSIVFGAGIVGTAISVFYAIDSVWILESGRSLLQISGRSASQAEANTAIIVSIVMAAVSWGIGTAGRAYINKSADSRAAETEKKATDR